MAQFQKHFVQDLTQDLKIRQCGTIVFNTDNLSNVVSVDLYNGETPATPAGTVVGAVICSDGSTVPITNGTISGNTVSITLTQACFAIGGQIGVGIQLVSGSTKTTVLKAIYNAEKFTTDDVVDPDSRITLSVSDLVDDIAAAVATIPASYSDLMAAVAPTFSTSTAYTAGKYVWYNGALYKFTADHAAGSWNASQVTAAVIGDELTQLKSATNQIENTTSFYKTLADSAEDFSADYVYKSDGTTAQMTYRCSCVARCDDTYLIEYRLNKFRNSSNNLNIISFLDANSEYISGIPAPTNGDIAVEGVIFVPENAVYVVGTWLTLLTEVPYMKGIKKESLVYDAQKLNENATSERDGKVELLSTANDFIVMDYAFNTSGDLINTGTFNTSGMYYCKPYGGIAYKLVSSYNSTRALNILSFFDADYKYVGGVPSTTYGILNVVEGVAAVPPNAVYCVGLWCSSATGSPYMIGYRKYSDAGVAEIVNDSMTKAEFIAAYNAQLSNYTTLCGCYIEAFDKIPDWSGSDASWALIYELLNRNFRKTVASADMTYSEICCNVNKAFTEPINLYNDAGYNNGIARNYSLKIANPEGVILREPSVMVSDDGSTMWLYTHLHRLSTKDGINWTAPEALTYLGGTTYIRHAGMCMIDGTYYMIGQAGDYNLYLFSSSDGLTFSQVGKIFLQGHEFVAGEPVLEWGNPYMIRNPIDKKYYLYIETKNVNTATPWAINLAVCTNLTHANEDGTVGDWQDYGNNPIITHPYRSIRENTAGGDAGNPDFCKLSDNNPVKVDGKYFMYFHSTVATANGFTAKITRASSPDLVNWGIDGTVYDNRVVPDSGDDMASNGDHCIIEFKGRTYMFYTVNINSQLTPYLAYVIDDRPIEQLLKMYP